MLVGIGGSKIIVFWCNARYICMLGDVGTQVNVMIIKAFHQAHAWAQYLSIYLEGHSQ